MALGNSNTVAKDILTYYMTTGTGSLISRPAAWYTSLHTGSVGETGANEVTTTGTATGNDTNYVRKAVTFSTPTGTHTANSAALTFPTVALPTGGGASSYTVNHFGIWSAATGGTYYRGGALTASKSLSAGERITFATGAITLTED
jgi:hypothetical protein